MSSVVKGEYDEMDGETLEDYIVKAKGFSYDTTATDLAQFFAGCDIKGGKAEGVHFHVSRTGKSNEAYIEFYEEGDLKRALGLNKKYMGDRYVDVTGVTKEQMESALAESDDRRVEEHRVIKLSGMPFTALHDDISIFFAGCDIKGGKKRGISFLRNTDGTAAGACFVEFLTGEDVKLALAKDKQYMGSRFCHVTKITGEEKNNQLAKQTEVLQDIKEPIIKLRGLPFKASDDDIRNFFPTLEIVTVEMVLNDQGNCRGEAFIEFSSMEDAKEAMKCYKLRLLHRYVDVTKSSRSDWMQMIPATDKVVKTAEDLEEPILRLKGLPVKVTKSEIEDFLFGIECRAVQVVRLPRGDCNGEAFVEFLSVEDAGKALEKHKSPFNAESGRDNVIDILASSRCDWRKEPAKERPARTPVERSRSPVRSPVRSRKRPLSNLDHSTDRESRYGSTPRVSAPVGYPASYGGSQSYDRVKEYLVNMVGLPFSATEEDIRQFFYPIRMTEIEFLKNDRGLPRGIAVVGFYSEDDRENAMLRNKNTIGNRYVNLHVRNEGRDYNFDFSKGAAGRVGGGREKRESFEQPRGRDSYSSGRDMRDVRDRREYSRY